MARREHQTKKIIADVIVQRGVEIRLCPALVCPGLHLVAELLVLLLEQLASAKMVYRPMLRDRHEPGGRALRNALLWPLLERGDERVLRELLREPQVAHDPRQTGDQLGRLDAPDSVNGAMRACGRPGPRSKHLRRSAQLGSRAATAPLRDARLPTPEDRYAAGMSCSRRTSLSPSPTTVRNRLVHSIASALVFTCSKQNPAMSSFVSGHGPSATENRSESIRTRAPFELGRHPSAASSTPPFLMSSMSLPIAAISSWVGGASVSFVPGR